MYARGTATARDAHWRESVMDNELMTGFISAGSNPMSLVTIQSLLDLGYAVDRNAAEAYTVPDPAGSGSAMAAVQQRIQLREANHLIPLYRVDADGRMQRIRCRLAGPPGGGPLPDRAFLGPLPDRAFLLTFRPPEASFLWKSPVIAGPPTVSCR